MSKSPHSDIITEEAATRGARRLVWSAAIGTMLYSATAMPYTMLLDRYGASGTMQGVAGAIAQFALLAQLPGAFVAETLRSRKLFFLSQLLACRLLWFTPAIVVCLMPFSDARALNIILLAVAISHLLDQFPAAAWYSWLADLIPARARGKFWTNRQIAMSVTTLVGTLACGLLLDKLGAFFGERPAFATVFTIGVGLGVTGAVIHWFVPEPRQVRVPLTRDFLASARGRIVGPLSNPAFRRLALAMGAFTFAIAAPAPFVALFLRERYAASYAALALIPLAAALGMVLFGKIFSRMMDRVGARNAGAACMVLAPALTVLAWLFAGPGTWTLALPWLGAVELHRGVTLVIAGSFAGAGLFLSVGVAHMVRVADVVPERGKTVAMALQFTIISLFGTAGAFAGGRLVDVVKAAAPDGFPLTLPGGESFRHIHLLILIQALVIWCAALPLFLKKQIPKFPNP